MQMTGHLKGGTGSIVHRNGYLLSVSIYNMARTGSRNLVLPRMIVSLRQQMQNEAVPDNTAGRSEKRGAPSARKTNRRPIESTPNFAINPRADRKEGKQNSKQPITK